MVKRYLFHSNVLLAISTVVRELYHILFVASAPGMVVGTQ